MTTNEEVRKMAIELARESGIVDGTGCLFIVCEQAIRDGEGTVERVREIWTEATEDAAAEAARENAEGVGPVPQGHR